MTDSSHGPHPEAKFVQDGRNGTHLKNYKEGYRTEGHREVHHILCHQCLQNSSIYLAEVDKTFVEKCLAKTNWDVNNADNLIGLPLKTAYTEKYSEHASWNKLPCHQVDHNPYYREAVKKWLHVKIWNTLKGEVKECNVDGKSVESDLNTASKHWHDFLVKRGKLHGGTKSCWDHRNDDKKDVWYIPFSMWPEEDEKSIPRRNVDWKYKGTSAARKAALQRILDNIK